MSRDITWWYKDYFLMVEEESVDDEKIEALLTEQKNLYKSTVEKVEPAKKVYKLTMKDVVGPWTLIITIFMSIICFAGLMYYIKKMRKQQDKEVFGITSMYSEKNDRMQSYYTSKAAGETPTQFLKRKTAEEAKEQKRKELEL